jgi:hypothetical protein
MDREGLKQVSKHGAEKHPNVIALKALKAMIVELERRP